MRVWMRMDAVRQKLGGISKNTVYLWIKKKRFPQPRRLSRGVAIWEKSEIDSWIKQAAGAAAIKPLIRMATVCQRTGVPRRTLYFWIRTGRFPQPIKLARRVVGWEESQVKDWIKRNRTRGVA